MTRPSRAYGPWKTVCQRFKQWRDNGTFEQVLQHLHLRLREDGFIDLNTWMVDSTSIRATRYASGAGKKGPTGAVAPLPRA
jgi:transposase